MNHQEFYGHSAFLYPTMKASILVNLQMELSLLSRKILYFLFIICLIEFQLWMLISFIIKWHFKHLYVLEIVKKIQKNETLANLKLFSKSYEIMITQEQDLRNECK